MSSVWHLRSSALHTTLPSHALFLLAVDCIWKHLPGGKARNLMFRLALTFFTTHETAVARVSFALAGIVL